jgi:hypothetical protein
MMSLLFLSVMAVAEAAAGQRRVDNSPRHRSRGALAHSEIFTIHIVGGDTTLRGRPTGSPALQFSVEFVESPDGSCRREASRGLTPHRSHRPTKRRPANLGRA